MTRQSKRVQQQQQKKQTTVKRTKSIQDVIEQAKEIQKRPIQVTKAIQKPQSPIRKKQSPAKKPQQKQQQKQEPKKQEQQPQKQKKQTNVKKTNSSFKNRKFQEEEIPKFINMEELQEGIHEMDQHRNFRERFLGKEGAFSAYKILIGCFIVNGSQHYINEVNGQAGQELKKRGFNYEITGSFNKFCQEMNDYDIVWILSSGSDRSESEKNLFYKNMDKFMKDKKSIFLWSDNDPLYVEANYFLTKYFEGMKMVGNYHGDKKITKSENDEIQKGTFDRNHSIGYGLNNLHEGITICHPVNTHKDFKNFALNTNNESCVLYADENENHGRIVLDCGYTKLYKQFWDGAGTHQYVSNANVWLTGIPM